jgi:RNase P/RNase MRP subunit POP5
VKNVTTKSWTFFSHNNGKTITQRKMVRIKYRYLLGSIFYPDEFSQRDEVIPDVVNFHRPSPKGFTPMDLRRVVVSSILENFGEYGGAAATPGLQGTLLTDIFTRYLLSG